MTCFCCTTFTSGGLLFHQRVSPFFGPKKGPSHLPFWISAPLPKGYNVTLTVFGETPVDRPLAGGADCQPQLSSENGRHRAESKSLFPNLGEGFPISTFWPLRDRSTFSDGPASWMKPPANVGSNDGSSSSLEGGPPSVHCGSNSSRLSSSRAVIFLKNRIVGCAKFIVHLRSLEVHKASLTEETSSPSQSMKRVTSQIGSGAIAPRWAEQ
jgi:hypothetical protein